MKGTLVPRNRFFLLLLIVLSFSSCNKEVQTDGHGHAIAQGSIRLTVHCVHHSWDVAYLNVYLKKNTSTFPGKDSSLYDLHIQADADGYAVFENLFPGDYYAYASGFDYDYGARVLGYAPLTLNSSTIVNYQSQFTLYVSE